MQDFTNRLIKRKKHLQKWARRTGLTCYRVYERDIKDIPLIVDWYDGKAVVWYCLPKGQGPSEKFTDRLNRWLPSITEAFQIEPEHIFTKYRYRRKDEGQYESNEKQGAVFHVEEYGLTFEVNLSDYVDTGLFLDHRTSRKLVREWSKDKTVLNLFSYTGSFTCYALAGGAKQTTTVDMSQTYCDWAKRNMALNGFDAETQEVIQSDCLQWLEQSVANKRRYDLIICDPPSHSNSKRMNRSFFSVDLHHPEILNNCAQLLNPGGRIFFSCNSRKFTLKEEELPNTLSVKEITKQTLPEDFRNDKIHVSYLLDNTR